jgi:hypothetical protein
MEHQDDKAKILDALGGKKGLLDSGLPAVLFLIIYNISDDLQVALYGAIGTSIVLTIIRLAMRDTIQHVISGLIGVLFCAYLANRSGNASDFYIPKLLTNLAYGSAYLIANLAGWPIIGVILGPLLGENFLWRKNPQRKRAYMRAGWLWVAMFFGRIAVQYPIYKSGNVNLLGTVNLAMGYPLFIATAWGTWMILKKVPTVKAD